MAKQYLIKKRFAYADAEKNTVYVQRWKMDGGKFVVDKKTQCKIQNVQALVGEALKVGKKCKAIEEIE